jgi:CRP-like cAMP-binding protein
MVDNADLEQLKKLSLFEHLTEAEMRLVGDSARTRSLDDGMFFFIQGDPADALFVLKQGRVKLIQNSADGQQILLRVIGPWSLFAIVALVEGGNYPISAQVVEPSLAFYWPRTVLMDLVKEIPSFALTAMRLMSERVQEYQDRIRELATERVERRVARALLRLASQSGRKVAEGVLIDMPLSRQDIAEMTGTTLYTVSRILSQWEQQEIVVTGREKVIVRFPHGLVRIAEDLP